MDEWRTAALKLVRKADYEYTKAEEALQDAVAGAIEAGVDMAKLVKATGQRAGTLEAWRILSRQRAEEHARRLEALDELTRMAQEDGLYDDPEANEFPVDTRLDPS